MIPLAFVQDVLARVVAIREEFDPAVRELVLEDLEYDLAAEVERVRYEAEAA